MGRVPAPEGRLMGGAARSAASSVCARGSIHSPQKCMCALLDIYNKVIPTPLTRREAVSEGQISNLAVGRQDASLSFTRARGAPDH